MTNARRSTRLARALLAPALMLILTAPAPGALPARSRAHAAAAPAARSAGGARAVTTTPASAATAAPKPSASPADLSSPTSFLLTGFDFEDAAGVCQTRGWVGEDRVDHIFSHLSSTFLANQQAFGGVHAPGSSDNLTGAVASTPLASPSAVTVNASGNLVFTDQGFGARLFELNPASGNVSLFGVLPFLSGLPAPRGVAFSPESSGVIVSDFAQGRLFRFDGISTSPNWIAGGGSNTGDGPVGSANLGTPTQIVAGPSGVLYYADPSTHRVRRVFAGSVATVVGTGVAGTGGTGVGTSIPLRNPTGVALDGARQRLYIGDTGNDRVLEYDLGLNTLLRSIPMPHPGALAFQPSTGGWGANGVALSTAAAPIGAVRSCPDGAGGAFVAWSDAHTGISNVYVRRVDSSGVPVGSVTQIAPGGFVEDSPALTPDGSGGAIVAWRDARNGPAGDIFAHHVLAGGTLDPAWGAGVALCMAGGPQVEPVVGPDGAGGAIVAWSDSRFGQSDIFAARVLAGGTLAWPIDGAPVCTASGGQDSSVVVPDGAGGAIIGWRDTRNVQPHIFAQRMNAFGVPQWATNGVIVSAPFATQGGLAGVSNSLGGAIFAWHDTQAGNFDIFAQNMNSSGSPLWSPTGVGVCTLPGSDQTTPTLVPDGVGGAIIAWQDTRGGVGSEDIYARRVNAGGVGIWPPTGIPVCVAGGKQTSLVSVPDGSGGIIVAWQDTRGGLSNADIYAQRLDPSGAVQWTTNGLGLCTATNNQLTPAVVSDGGAGVIAAWTDLRPGVPGIYAQRANPTDGLLSIESDPKIINLSLPSLGQSVAAGGDGYGPLSGASLASQQLLVAPQGFAPDGAGGLYFVDPSLDLVMHLSSGQVLPVAGMPLSMLMGAQAMWVGADATSDAAEVANWVDPVGYGNDWSQRLTSGPFSLAGHPQATLRFDAALDFGPVLAPGVVEVSQSFHGEWMAVQAQEPDGSWAFLHVRLAGPTTPQYALQTFYGRGLVRVTAALDQDGNNALGLSGTTRFRIVVQTDDEISNEDGRSGPTRGAAVIDNLSVTDAGGAVVPSENFESGPGAQWHATAENGVPFDFGCPAPGMAARPAATRPASAAVTDCQPYARDFPNNMVTVGLRSGFDPQDPSCAWTFVANGDSVPNGVYARLTSPWFALSPAESTFAIHFAGKLNSLDEGRFLRVFIRGKREGETQPSFIAQPRQLLTSGTQGGDEGSPFFADQPLNYPADFFSPLAAESIQVVFQVEDRAENLPGHPVDGRPRTRLPYLDSFRLEQDGLDSDHDGVADAVDLCPESDATGQDGDANGCVDPDATLHHVESWARQDLPLHYRISQGADPANPNAEDATEIAAGFTAWTLAPHCTLTVVRDADTPQVNADAMDGINLVTFQDPDFQFPPGVLAVTPTLSFTRRGLYHDRIVLPGQIVDADMIFNPEAHFSTPHFTPPGVTSYDLRSVTTHEAGHFFGLSHSGVLRATMFFVIQPGSNAATLEADDIAAISAAYPKPDFDTALGTITGTVTRGSDGLPVPGALVTAVLLSDGVPVDSTASDYTDLTGTYHLRGLANGSYAVRVTPLDGEVGGFPLTPDFISERVANGAQTNFGAEWWSVPESNNDDPNLFTGIDVAGGTTSSGKNIITNIDTTPPTVTASFPTAGATDVRPDATLLVAFSERIDPTTIAAAFHLHVLGGTGTLGGTVRTVNGDRTLIFSPTAALAVGTSYTLDLTNKLTDREGVPLNPELHLNFSTIATAGYAISDVEPRAAAAGSYITVLGGGFDPGTANIVIFDGCSDCGSPEVQAINVTTTSMVVQVPPAAATGNLRVRVNSVVSNTFPFQVLAPAPQVSPSPVADIPLPFPPSDVALAPGGGYAYAVGSGGLALVNLGTRVVTVRALGASSRAALTADGKRLLVTQPAAGQVLDVDADPTSTTLGDTKATIPTGTPGHPDGIAMAPSGRRAFVSDQADGTIYEIDTDAGSGTRDQVIDELTEAGAVLTGGLAVMPTGDLLLYTTGNDGSISRTIGSTAFSVLHPGASEGGVAATPRADEVLYVGSGAFAGDLLSSQISLGDPGAQSQIPLGGNPRDVIVAPQGQSALAVNSTSDQLQVVGMKASDPTYHTVVASVATGSNPVALSQSQDGSLIAVANFGARSIGLYRSGGTLGLVRSLPAVARPGDRVAVQPSTNLFGAGSQVDLGLGAFAPDYRLPSGAGAAFPVPAGPQRDAGLAGIDPTGTRTLPLPFRVVDPISAFNPQGTGTQLPLSNLGCFINTVGNLDAMRLSPDGSLLALVRNPVACPGVVELYAADDTRPKDFGQPLVRGAHIPADGQALDMAFTPDGRRLWVTNNGLDVRVVDTDRSSPTFGALLTTLTGGIGGGPAGIAADPLGRYMCAASQAGTALVLVTPSGTFVTSLTIASQGDALQASPDGRTLVVAGGGRAMFVNLETPAVIGSSAVHGSTALHQQQYGVAIPTNGKRAVVRFTTGIGIYNLDPAAGAIGAELYFGNPLGGGVTLTQLVPGPRGDDVLAGSSTVNNLVRIDTSVLPPAITYAAIGQPSQRLASSPDGRSLWVGRSASTSNGDVKLFGLGRATGLALVSGANQSGLAGATLPLPIRVRATDAGGVPEAGVAVRFTTASGAGSLDRDSSVVMHLTDANGEAQVSWTLPATIGVDHLAIAALGVPGGSLTVDGTVVADNSQIIPAVVEIGPPNGSSNFNIGTPVFVRFNQMMDPNSVTTKIKLFADGAPVSGAFNLQERGQFVLFQPSQPLAFAARCSLTVAAGALDLDGQALPTSALSVFHVQAAPPLAVTGVTPPAAAPGAPIVLDGTGFSPTPSQNTVLVNGMPSTVTTASPTSISVPVPQGAQSGPLTVQVGSALSPGVNFTVLTPSGAITGTQGDLPAGPSATKVVITSDGKRAYVTNPSSSTVTALDLVTLQQLAVITVGIQPSGLDLLPDNSRLYVCNQGSDDVSVIDTNPASPTYHKVIKTIPVGHQPRDLAVSGFGPVAIVVDFGSTDLKVIDANSLNATFDQVVTTTNLGSGGNAIGITPDGGLAYIVTAGGTVEKFDLKSGAVVTTTNLGSGGNAIGITPDGTLALVLLQNGGLVAINIVPGTNRENQVVASTNTGSGGGGGGGGLAISPDGGTAYVTNTDGNIVFVYQIVGGSSGQVTFVPGPLVSFVKVDSIPVGPSPRGVAIDPALGAFGLVANSGSGTVTILGRLGVQPPIAVTFKFNPSALNLKSLGHWVKGTITPPAPYTPADIVISSLRLNGVVPVDPAAPVGIGEDGPGVLTVRFTRSQVELVLPEGDAVPVTVTGTIGTRQLAGTDFIKVKRGQVLKPAAAEMLQTGHPYTVTWSTPNGVQVQWVAILHSYDKGANWTLDATHLPNTGDYRWWTPWQNSDSVKVAVAWVESGDTTGTAVQGVLGVSGYFKIYGVTDVEPAPAQLTFAPLRPNPAVGSIHMRYGLPRATRVRLEIFDLQGRRVRTLASGDQPAGWYDVEWSGRTEGGVAGPGIYFVMFRAEGREFRQRMVWLH